MAESNFEKEMNKEIESRIQFYENNPDINKPFNKVNYIGAFSFALFGLILLVLSAI